MKNFLKNNWIYAALALFIIILNVMPVISSKDEREEVKKEERSGKGTLFVSMEEAGERTREIEEKLSRKPALFVFYVSLNLFILLIFVLGVFIDVYFVRKKLRRENVFPSPGRVPSISWRMTDVLKIIILSIAASYIFFLTLAFSAKLAESVFNVKFTALRNDNFRMIFDTIAVDTFVLSSVGFFILHIHGKKISDLGFYKKEAWRNIFYGIKGYLGVIPVIFMVGMAVYFVIDLFKLKPPPQPIVGLLLSEKNAGLVLFSGIIAAIFGPFAEEVFFRGVIYNAIKKGLGIFWGIMITSALFSFLHTHALTYFLVGFIPITILGIVLAYLYEKTGSLVPSVTLHVLNNLGSVSLVFLLRFFNEYAAK